MAIRAILPPDDRRLSKLRGKIFRRWKRPILIILDGANERGAILAAWRILQDLQAHRHQIPSHFRILFTTRSNTLNDIGLILTRSILVPPFSDSELTAALAKFAPNVALNELSDRIRPFAAIPRYFRVCVQLREQLGSVSVLTVELILWTDLMSKLSRNDPQWRHIQEKSAIHQWQC